MSDSPSQPLAASFRDPSGFLYTRDGTLYRQVNRSYAPAYDLLITSGLYGSLTAAGLLIPHKEVEIPPAEPELAYKTLQPEPVTFISYPYEWSFSQLKDAALTTLAIQKRRARNEKTGQAITASWTMTNVAPHTATTAIRERSAIS